MHLLGTAIVIKASSCYVTLKKWFRSPRIEILSLFTHLHVFPNSYALSFFFFCPNTKGTALFMLFSMQIQWMVYEALRRVLYILVALQECYSLKYLDDFKNIFFGMAFVYFYRFTELQTPH